MEKYYDGIPKDTKKLWVKKKRKWSSGRGCWEKVQNIVGDEERKRTNIISVYDMLDRILGSFMPIAYVTSTNVETMDDYFIW